MADDLARLVSPLAPVAGHNPWPRYVVDAATWEEAGRLLGSGACDLLGLWGERETVHLALRAAALPAPCILSLPVAAQSFPSIGRHHAPAIRLERALHDLYGFHAEDAPDPRPWLDHGAWGVQAPLGSAEAAPLRDPADYPFASATGQGLHQVPVGPVHAGVIEPGHFRFTANGETVVRLEQRLGYVHRGIDALLTDTELRKAQRIVARVSGDSTVALSFAFARAAEAALGIIVPERAQVIRGVMAELERIANHFGDIGAICNDATFPLIHAYCGIFRERILAACDAVFSHRLMMDEIVPGGVMQNISAGGAAEIMRALDAVERPFARICRLYDDSPSLQDRTCFTGIVSHDLVTQWAAGGHVGRASGRDFDTRRDLAYAPYAGVTLAVPVCPTGDVDARVRIRMREVEESIRLLRRWLAALPDGEILVDVPRVEEGREGVAMVEAFRGDILVWLRLDPDGRVARCHVRDASWFQWPLLEAAVANTIVADFPLCNKSFNCSYAGHDL